MRFRKKPKKSILSYFFVWLKTPCKILEPYDNSFWEKSNPAERRKKELFWENKTWRTSPWRLSPYAVGFMLEEQGYMPEVLDYMAEEWGYMQYGGVVLLYGAMIL